MKLVSLKTKGYCNLIVSDTTSINSDIKESFHNPFMKVVTMAMD